MAYPFTTVLNLVQAKYYDCDYNQIGWINNHATSLYYYLYHGDYSNAAFQALYCFQGVTRALADILANVGYSSYNYGVLGMLDYLNTNSFNMDVLLSGMLQADFDQLTQFIGIEDAYRSAIWDQPFNAEFYAALARGFMP